MIGEVVVSSLLALPLLLSPSSSPEVVGIGSTLVFAIIWLNISNEIP